MPRRKKSTLDGRAKCRRNADAKATHYLATHQQNTSQDGQDIQKPQDVPQLPEDLGKEQVEIPVPFGHYRP